jgi:hypothetical protein
MTHKTRNIIFIILIILFLITAPIVVFYSLGWRFDWKTKGFYQIGMFSVNAWPKTIDIYINGQLKEKTDIFFGSATIDNLMPTKYNLEAKKQGYHSWNKSLEITEGNVTEVKNLVLIPENPNFNSLTSSVKEFFFSPDNKKIILKEENEEKWSLKLFELNNNLKSYLINEEDISTKGVEIINLLFSPDSKRIVLKLGLKEDIKYYVIDIDKSPIITHELEFLDETEEIYFHSDNNESLIGLISSINETTKRESRTLNEINYIEKKILEPITENVLTATIINKDIYYIDIEGFVIKSDLSGNKEKLNIIPFGLKQETKYELLIYNDYIFIKENDTLYLLDDDTKSFKKFFEPIKEQKLSSDSKKLVYYNNYEIYVLFLEKQYDPPQKEAKETLFITRFSEEIKNVFWYTDYYLIFNVGDKIKIAEIDDRDRINIIDLAEFKDSNIFFANKKLYVLSEDNLSVSDTLTP